jgi:hypothetical protein
MRLHEIADPNDYNLPAFKLTEVAMPIGRIQRRKAVDDVQTPSKTKLATTKTMPSDTR